MRTLQSDGKAEVSEIVGRWARQIPVARASFWYAAGPGKASARHIGNRALVHVM